MHERIHEHNTHLHAGVPTYIINIYVPLCTYLRSNTAYWWNVQVHVDCICTYQPAYTYIQCILTYAYFVCTTWDRAVNICINTHTRLYGCVSIYMHCGTLACLLHQVVCMCICEWNLMYAHIQTRIHTYIHTCRYNIHAPRCMWWSHSKHCRILLHTANVCV